MSNIELRTTQNVVIEYELATLADRMLAFLVDLLIVAGLYLLLILLLLFFDNVSEHLPWGILYGLFPIIFFMLYHFLSEVFTEGRSWGKKVIGLKVVRSDGQQPHLSDYLLRAVLHLIDTIGSGGVLAAIFISSTPQRRRLGDLTANTVVIRIKSSDRFRLSDILRISTLADYTPAYPEVKRFTEQDMLLVKTTLARFQRFPNAAHRTALQELTDTVCQQMQLPTPPPTRQEEFLRTLLHDYIVLTR